MSIIYTKNSNKNINRVLKEQIIAVAQAYCESGLLHIGYVVHPHDKRCSHYIPDSDELPALVICSEENKIVDTYDIYKK